jgi:SAM-dependent methyltransferase
MNIQLDYAGFPDRDDRALYIVRRFRSLLKGRVLDVGCDRARVKKLLPELDYTGIDVGGEPDLVVNLEQTDRLPFEDNRFDCVLCSDVLEHLENIHHVFGELVRVTRRHLVLSLPNNWACARRPLGRGHGRIAHYGLPPEPVPDRHKWFFNFSEAMAFVDAQAAKHGVRIDEIIVTEKPRFFATRLLRRIRYPRFWDYQNRYGNTLWWVIRK